MLSVEVAVASLFGRYQTATIFGNMFEKDERPPPPPPPRQRGGQRQLPPPPPGQRPPPPPLRGDGNKTTRPLPPSPSNFWGGPQQGHPPPPDMWGPPSDRWNAPSPPFDPSILHHDLEESLQRQQDLIMQAQNLTSMIAAFEQREELHMRQLDVLTERVMDVESLAATERNQMLEYQANCTELGLQVAVLEGEVEEWRQKCTEYVEKQEEDHRHIADLKKALKKSKLEVEDLAALIERYRLNVRGDDSYRRRKAKKRRGFFAWLFGWGEEDEESDLDGVFEEARSTLLSALQTERNSVHELESVVTSLQQNNSAISEQLQSRDLIIDELNDRIAVFEEDKVVLKAALKQLQVEMSEEAPKTQKLVNDLKGAQSEVDRLSSVIEAMIAGHDKDIAAMKEKLAAKELQLNQTEANLTVIGSYVDRLESRLGDFAVARRDIEAREKKCKGIEDDLVKAKKDRDESLDRVKELEKEHEELKTLIQEMVNERATLQSKNQLLEKECNSLREQEQNILRSFSDLQNSYEALEEVNQKLKVQVDEFELKAQGSEAAKADLQRQLEQSRAEVKQLRSRFEGSSVESSQTVEKLQRAENTLLELQNRLANAEEAKEELTRRYDDAIHQMQASMPPRVGSFEVHLADLQSPTKQFVDRGLPKLSGANVVSTSLPPVKPMERVPGEKTAVPPPPEKRAPPLNGRQPLPPPLATNRTQMPKRDSMVPMSVGNVMATKARAGPKKPLRSVRKFFAKTTGMHGAFTKGYKKPAAVLVPKVPPIERHNVTTIPPGNTTVPSTNTTAPPKQPPSAAKSPVTAEPPEMGVKPPSKPVLPQQTQRSIPQSPYPPMPAQGRPPQRAHSQMKPPGAGGNPLRREQPKEPESNKKRSPLFPGVPPSK